MISKICICCNKKFQTRPREGRGKFCSNVCKYQNMKGKKPWNTGGKSISLSVSKTGDKNPNWKGGCDKKKANREYGMKNREKIYKKQRIWNEKNRDKIKEWGSRWAKANPEIRAITWQRRRLKEIQLGGDMTKKEWSDIKEKQNYQCKMCHKKEPEIRLTMDHIIPVSKWAEWIKDKKVDYQCGDSKNIQGLCRKCNAKKGQKLLTV